MNALITVAIVGICAVFNDVCLFKKHWNDLTAFFAGAVEILIHSEYED